MINDPLLFFLILDIEQSCLDPETYSEKTLRRSVLQKQLSN